MADSFFALLRRGGFDAPDDAAPRSADERRSNRGRRIRAIVEILTHPEKLYKEPLLMASVMACTVVMTVLLFVDVPLLYRAFTPTLMHH